jgi:hypothetical protein
VEVETMRLIYVLAGNLVGVILGLLLMAILAICGVGWVSVAWGVLVYVVLLIVGIVLACFDPLDLDD